MHAQTRRTAFILGSLLLMGTGAFAVACGTDNGTTPLPGEQDAGGTGKDATVNGGDSGGNTGTDSGGNTGTDGGGNMDMDAGVDCGKIPTLHAPGAGPFCPFQAYADGAAAFGDCDSGQHCCDYQGASPTPPATCNGSAAACAPQTGFITIDWACDTKAHCTAGQECCMYGKDGGTTNVTVNSMCPTGELLKANNVGGTHCEATCAAGEVKLCQDDTDCTAPQKCTAFPTNAQQLGVCK
jgi:hypothetical protein